MLVTKTRLDGWADDALRGAIKGIKIETSFTPPIEIRDPFAPAPPGSSGALALLKPRITLDTPTGPVVLKPYGIPDNHWRDVQLGLAALGLGITWLIIRAFRRR